MDTTVIREQRTKFHLRIIFDSACEITAPYIGNQRNLFGHGFTLAALHALHDAFPEISEQDICILFAAVKQHHQDAKS